MGIEEFDGRIWAEYGVQIGFSTKNQMPGKPEGRASRRLEILGCQPWAGTTEAAGQRPALPMAVPAKQKAPTKAGAFHYNWCRK